MYEYFPVLTVTQAAKLLIQSRRGILKEIHAGNIPAFNCGSRWYIPQLWVEQRLGLVGRLYDGERESLKPERIRNLVVRGPSRFASPEYQKWVVRTPKADHDAMMSEVEAALEKWKQVAADSIVPTAV